MSLTNQLHARGSIASDFFRNSADQMGIRFCAKQLRESRAGNQPDGINRIRSYLPAVGITIEYVIRYIANNYHLVIEDTVIGEGWERMPRYASYNSHTEAAGQTLLDYIGRIYIDGRPVDELVIYSCTALSILEGLIKSGFFPRSFNQEITKENENIIRGLKFAQTFEEKKVLWLFDEYCLNTLQWDVFVQDIQNMARIFLNAIQPPQGSFSGAEFPVLSRALYRGNRIDCVVNKDGYSILTDIKAISRPLAKSEFQQLLSYALLHDEVNDRFEITALGVYYARTGTFKYLPLDTIVRQCFPNYGSLEAAKSAFNINRY